MARETLWGAIRIEDAALAGGFVQVPALVFFDRGISSGAKVMYGALLWYAWKHRKAPEQKVMAEDLGVSLRTVQGYLAELEKTAYIEIVQLGLGRPNEYIIKSLHTRPGGLKRPENPDTQDSACLARRSLRVKDARSCASHRVVDSDVTTQTFSHRGNGAALADAFFASIGEAKPAKARRERALGIINGLTAEGFTEEAVREACRLAGERGARGPDLLPHVIGEAHERIEARTAQATRRQQIASEGEAQLSLDEASLRAELAAVEALPAADRDRLESECRAALPATVSEGMVAAVLPGMVAARLREGQGNG
jgi:hypothetical protein